MSKESNKIHDLHEIETDILLSKAERRFYLAEVCFWYFPSLLSMTLIYVDVLLRGLSVEESVDSNNFLIKTAIVMFFVPSLSKLFLMALPLEYYRLKNK